MSDDGGGADGGAEPGRDPDSEIDQLREGMKSSKGDPRVLIVMNLILSALFAWVVVAGLSLIDAMEFTVLNVATLALVVFAMTYVVTRP